MRTVNNKTSLGNISSTTTGALVVGRLDVTNINTSSECSRIGTGGLSQRLTRVLFSASGNTTLTGVNLCTYIERNTATAPTDTLPTTANIISTFAASMEGGVWNDYELVDVLFKNSCSGTWTIQRGDSSTVFGGNSAGSSLTISTGNSLFIRFVKTSSTTIMIKSF